MSVYQGDPAIKITEDGATLNFIEGQPVMDKGFENLVLISLFTRRDWSGNALFQNESQKIGSDFEKAAEGPVRLQTLNEIRDAALKALQPPINDGIFQDVAVEVTNPNADNIMVKIRITPPNGEEVDLTLENFGSNWRFQKEDPAHRRLEC